MLEDNAGKIWFGTDKGLTNYDGNMFINFSGQQGLNSNSNFALVQDHMEKNRIGSNGGIN